MKEKEVKNILLKHTVIIKMLDLKSTISIIILNVNV
jgi:hypothetical protein